MSVKCADCVPADAVAKPPSSDGSFMSEVVHTLIWRASPRTACGQINPELSSPLTRQVRGRRGGEEGPHLHLYVYVDARCALAGDM